MYSPLHRKVNTAFQVHAERGLLKPGKAALGNVIVMLAESPDPAR